ncbi:MAG: DUF3267 domain-containing protein [Chloroflexota bacterium]
MTEGNPPPASGDYSVPIEEVVGKVTLWGLLLMFVPLVPYIALYGFGSLFGEFRPLAALALIVVFTLAHEGFHVFGWKYWGNLPWSKFEFGFKWEALAPYAHATAPMQASAYKLGTALPGVMTGLLPYGIALALGDPTMTLVGAVMISGAVGDLYVLWLLRDVPPDAYLKDHPENVGCILVDGPDSHKA